MIPQNLIVYYIDTKVDGVYQFNLTREFAIYSAVEFLLTSQVPTGHQAFLDHQKGITHTGKSLEDQNWNMQKQNGVVHILWAVYRWYS